MIAGSEICVILFCFSCLLYASWSDIKSRSVPNRLWLLMIAVGIPVLSYTLFIYRLPFLIPFTFSLLLTLLLSYLCFRLYLFGGADAKSLICLAVLMPVHPHFQVFSHHFPLTLPPNAGLIPFPFAISTLLNASIPSLTVPVALVWYNLWNIRIRGLKKPLRYLFIGYPMGINALPEVKHVRLIHRYEERDGKVARTVVFGGVELSSALIEKLRDYAAEGKIDGTIWVTPDLPFMLFITAGFVTSLLYGNFLFVIF